MFAGAAAALTAVLGAGLRVSAQGNPDRDRDLRALAMDANGVPSEFSADALLRIAGSGRVTDKEWQRYLLDEAFMRAYGAQDQYRRTTTDMIPPDSRQGADRQASDTALTRVSLQIRVVQLMRSLDPRRARELFEWIELNLAPGACGDPLVPAVEEYYIALSQLARTFGGNRANALNFFELYLWRAHLPSEMPSVVRAVQRFRSGRDEAAYLEGQFRLILEGSSADARGFSSANLDILSRTADLQTADRAIGVPNWYLMDAVRDYLLAHLGKPRCADSITEATVPSAFNSTLKRIGAEKDVSAIENSNLHAPLLLGAARIDLYWQTPEARRLYDEEFALRGSGKVPRPVKERQTTEWSNQAEQVLMDIDHWSGTREPAERDFFYEKSVLFTGLIDLIPPGALRMRAVRACVEFLRRANVDRDRRTLWFAMLTRLFEMAHGADRRDILTAIEESHHAVLSLYARLERATPAARADTRPPTDGILARRRIPAASPSSSGTTAGGPAAAPF
jgi:hypothetical protein